MYFESGLGLDLLQTPDSDQVNLCKFTQSFQGRLCEV